VCILSQLVMIAHLYSPGLGSWSGSLRSGRPLIRPSTDAHESEIGPGPRRGLLDVDNANEASELGQVASTVVAECSANCTLLDTGKVVRSEDVVDSQGGSEDWQGHHDGDLKHQRGLKHATMSHSTVSVGTTLSKTTSTVVFCATAGGTLTVTLPNANGLSEGTKVMRYYTIVNKNTANTCTVQTSSSEKIYTSLHTTAWLDTSPYDRVYGGQTATGSNAAFTDNSVMTTMYGHNQATLTVTSNFNAAPGTSTVISNIAVSPTTVQATVPNSRSAVVQTLTTTKHQCVYGYSHSDMNFLNDFGTSATTNGMTGASMSPTSVMYDVLVYHNHQDYRLPTKYVGNNPGTYSNFPVRIVTSISFSNIYDTPYSRTVAANIFNNPTNQKTLVVKSVNAPTSPSIATINYQQAASCVQAIPTSPIQVVTSIGSNPTTVVGSFTPSPTTVVSNVPTISSSATLTARSVATDVRGNIAVSHGYSLRSPTSVTGTIYVTDKTTYNEQTSIVLQPGASATLIAESGSWYQIGGTYGGTGGPA